MGIITTLVKHRISTSSAARAQIKGEIKAAKARAKEEIRRQAKAERHRTKLLARQERSLLKNQSKGEKAKQKHERKLAKSALATAKAGRFNKKNVLRYTAAARTILPVAVPLIYRAATLLRAQLVSIQAQRLGVSADQLAEHAGHGGPLKARINGLSSSLDTSVLPAGFVQDVRERLDQLSSAVDNAEYMTEKQRRLAHKSIIRDIDALANQIQERLLHENS